MMTTLIIRLFMQFLDSLVGDAAWLARYAKNRQGEVIPWSLLEREIRETHAFEVNLAEIGKTCFLLVEMCGRSG